MVLMSCSGGIDAKLTNEWVDNNCSALRRQAREKILVVINESF
jgi:hypothetical protein